MNTISMDEISNGHTIHPNPTNETERAKKGENVARCVCGIHKQKRENNGWNGGGVEGLEKMAILWLLNLTLTRDAMAWSDIVLLK